MKDVIIVHYVDQVPANAERVNSFFYRDPNRATYSYWRGRWARVTHDQNALYCGELLYAIDTEKLPFRWEKFSG